MKTRPAIDEIAEAIDAALPDLDSTDQRIASAIHRPISSREPGISAIASSEASGARWVAEHHGTTLPSVEEAFELGRRLTKRIAPDLSSEVSRHDRQS